MATVINGTTGIDKVQDGSIVASDLNGNQTGTAPIYGCRAWVNFDGTRNVTDTGASTIGQPVKIRASGNVTSVTKNGVGDFTINFTIAMPDANFALNLNGGSGVTNSYYSSNGNAQANTTTSCRIVTGTIAMPAGTIDAQYNSVSIFR